MFLLLFAMLQLGLVQAADAKVPTRIPEDPVRGRDLWEAHCWQCHGPDGEGDGPLSAALPTPIDPLPTLEGLPWEPVVAVVAEGAGDMPAYGHVITEPDIRRILVWINDQQRGAGKIKARRRTPTSAELEAEPDDVEEVEADETVEDADPPEPDIDEDDGGPDAEDEE